MIVRMAKVAVIGPKEDMISVLSLIRKLGVLQIEKESPEKIEQKAVDSHVQGLRLDRELLKQSFFLEELKEKISPLLDLTSSYDFRESYLSPENILDSIANLVEKHLNQCREWSQNKENIAREISHLSRFKEFLDCITPLLPEEVESPELDYIGVEIRDISAMEKLEHLASKVTEGKFDLKTAQTERGTLVGLIITETEFIKTLQEGLKTSRIQDFVLPESLAALSFPEKIKETEILLKKEKTDLEALEKKISTFAFQWSGIYRKVMHWIDRQLTLIKASALLFETDMCFVISGWLPAGELETLKKEIDDRFSGRVVVEEKELREEDLAHAPVLLMNRGYFQPFELLARLLPVPGYGSFDITPFLGIFFPIFFGMMLGDMGYGLILLAASLALIKLSSGKNLQDAGKIFTVAAVYTIIFGFLYGEFFGTIGVKFFGLKTILLDRHESIIPMLYFALAVGVVHILLGLVLGVISSIRQKEHKESVFKIGSIILVLCLILLLITKFYPVAAQTIQKPLLLVLLIALPVILLTGGFLAPLEVLKHIGNIISYARIMAIGLTSVLLAHAANKMAGMMGSIWLGIFVAILLHGFNIILGIFAPTIHALRLHYVEFFSKIMAPGGREYKPLRNNSEEENNGRSYEY